MSCCPSFHLLFEVFAHIPICLIVRYTIRTLFCNSPMGAPVVQFPSDPPIHLALAAPLTLFVLETLFVLGRAGNIFGVWRALIFLFRSAVCANKAEKGRTALPLPCVCRLLFFARAYTIYTSATLSVGVYECYFRPLIY